MPRYEELVKKYTKRRKENLIDTVTAGLSYADNLAVDLGLMEDSGVIDTLTAAMPFAVIAVTEQMRVILGRKTGKAGFSDAVQELADQFMGLSEINPGKVVQALLTPLADMAIKEGEILIAQGIGVEACKEALESLNGWAAIAAGASLVAIGAAAKSGLAALAQGGGRSTATTSYGTSSSSTSNVQTIQTEMTVYVTGRISGNDILLSGKKTQDSLNR